MSPAGEVLADRLYFSVSHVARRILGRRRAAYLKEHSPIDFVMALVIRRRWEAYYEQAKRAYGRVGVPDRALTGQGAVFVKQAFHVPPDMLKTIRWQFETGECVSFLNGRKYSGNVEGSEKVFLTKGAIREFISEVFLDSKCLLALEDHMSCYARIVNASLYKTFPHRHPDFGGFEWHRDRLPEHSYKVLTYLTEVGPGDGAFVYSPGSHRSNKVLPNFGRRTPNRKVVNLKEYCGGPGDAIVFDVNGYHRGGASVGRERIVVSVHVQPSKTPCRAHYELHGFGSVGEKELGVDPEKVWWNAS